MGLFSKQKISPVFNYQTDAQKQLSAYTITLTRPAADLATQSDAFRTTLERWLRMQQDDQKGNAEKPAVTAAEAGHARVTIRTTEETMARIERQFGGDILRTDPPAEHARGLVKPSKVDPWDVSKW